MNDKQLFCSGLWSVIGQALLLVFLAVPLVLHAQISTGAAMTSLSTGSLPSASQGQVPTALPPGFAQLRIEPGDLISVHIYDAPDISQPYRVDGNGNITMPLCGSINVRGLTATEAAERLEEALKKGQILLHPQVNVDVQQYAGQYVNVMGEVIRPGPVAIMAPQKLGDILAQAGGVTQLAGAYIAIRHPAGDTEPAIEVPYSRSRSNPQLDSVLVRPGDTVMVPRAGIIYVLGAVFRPGGYVMQEDGKLNVAEALALSGGTLMQARTNGLRVIRRKSDGTILDFSLSYDGIVKGSQTPLQLRPEDIVYVPISRLKATLTSATQIISSAATAGIYVAAGY